MDNSFEFSLVFNNDVENNTLTVTSPSSLYREVGGALEVALDKDSGDTVLTFWDENGERKEARLDMELADAPAEGLAEEATELGYYVEPHDPCSGFFVGLYIQEKVNEFWAAAMLETQERKARAEAG